MGIITIINTDNIILIGRDKNKNLMIADLVENLCHLFYPGSIIQNNQKKFIVLDNLAVSDLKLYDYFT